MALKPWYKVDGILPREDLREGKGLDTAEFAVHLDQVRDKRAPADYQDPQRFFERTYLTKSLTEFAAQVVRRLSGETAETSAVFNLATQFGGGKTHALTLLYHLAKNGPTAQSWPGVDLILERAGITSIAEANVAVFVGTEFDSITGRGGDDGTPRRRTPWGEIAYQLGGEEAFAVVAEHEEQFIEPKGDVIRAMLPKDKPCLILMDEIINYVSTYRTKGYNDRLYNFLQALSETARGEKNVVLVASIPASEMEYTEKDEADEQRFKKMLDRLGKAYIMSAESETSEIIRRRLFEWDASAISSGGKIMLSRDAVKTCNEYADWMLEHRQQLPSWFPIDNAREVFQATYPFHPTLLSVFERKWQVLPRFQRTRGVLRMLALWVADAYQKGFKGAHKDPLITLGTAPLDNPDFRSAVFEQMGDGRLEAAVTTDICGKIESHAVRFDAEAINDIKKARLHRKVSTAIFFESNGGCTRTEATIPEIRLDVADAALDIGHVETVLDAMATDFYYLAIEKNKYRFTLSPNLNKILADRRAGVQSPRMDECVREYVQKVFGPAKGITPIYFPTKSTDIPNRPALAFAVMLPENSIQEANTLKLAETLIRESGGCDRTFKSAVIIAIADSNTQLREEARKLLAWEDIRDEGIEGLDDNQKRQLKENVPKAQRDLKEAIWRTYKHIAMLDKKNNIQTLDLGLINSSSSTSMTEYILQELQKLDYIQDFINARFLVRTWPPAFIEWSTKSVRDTCFASPQFPRLLDPDTIRQTIASGVSGGTIAYVGKAGERYEPFKFNDGLSPNDIEISEDMFIISGENAAAYQQRITEPPKLSTIKVDPGTAQIYSGDKQTFLAKGLDQYGDPFTLETITWSATGGTIDSEGTFTASNSSGSFIVTAKSEEVSGTAQCHVQVKPQDGTGHYPSKKGDTGTQIPIPDGGDKPTPQTSVLKWSGEVPTQKWTNFYMRVLSKFAADKNLKLNLKVTVEVEGDVSEQKLQETETALKELGLDGTLE